MVQWNIERGYELDKVIAHLAEVDADIVSLQEVDIGCERSAKLDTGALIAHALGYNYLFICEFEELLSPLRDPRSQGGGVHGNAILTKYDFVGWKVVEHSRHPVDWNNPSHPLALKEPRRGRRLTLAADIRTPMGDLRLYNCHLEVRSRQPCN
jgi:endonuclease/exonuclease/phosphatase family metal-dependent hydrolase